MNVYQKLQQARIKLQGKELKKSGHNKFAGYQYFELGDFLPSIQEIFNETGLCGTISFELEFATLRVTNMEDPQDYIIFSSPMSSAALKGCHEVQNLGAVQTYLRRYLWVSVMEIVEHDALDASEPIKHNLTESRKKISTSYAETLTQERKDALSSKAAEISFIWETDMDFAVNEYVTFRDSLDTDEQAAFKHFLDEVNPKLRNGLLKHYKAMNGE